MIFCNGDFYSTSQPVLPASDRGFLFADGIFTTMRVIDGRIEFFKAHCERFYLHCQLMKFSPPAVELNDLFKLIELNQALKGVWRLKIIASAKSGEDQNSTLRPLGNHLMLIEAERTAQKETLSLRTYPRPISTPFSSLKTLACASRFYLQEEAQRQGCDDVVVLSPDGFITETAFANFFWRVEDQLFSPSPTLPMMQGVSIMFIKMAAKILNLNWNEVEVTPFEIPKNAQLFICNAMKGMIPVTEYDRVTYSRDLNFENSLRKNYNDLANFFSVSNKTYTEEL